MPLKLLSPQEINSRRLYEIKGKDFSDSVGD